jgi:hypothetical protein
LKAQVKTEAPPDKQNAILERLAELEEAITATPPDLDTMAYLKNWFLKHAPGPAGVITALLAGPVVRQMVAMAGEAVAAEFGRRF